MEIGDQVQVKVRRVSSPIRFEVEIVSVRRPIAPQQPAPQRRTEPSMPSVDEPVSDKAKDLFAQLQAHWAAQEDKDVE